MRQAALFLLISVLASACAPETHEAVIQPALAPCTGLANQFCMVISEDGGEPGLFYDGIEGFTFQWGVEARILYTVEEVDDPPADGSSGNYRFERLIDAKVDEPGTIYELRFRNESIDRPWFTPDSEGAGTVQMFGTRVACDQAVCDQLLAGIPGAEFRVTFELTDTPLMPLRAIAVTL